MGRLYIDEIIDGFEIDQIIFDGPSRIRKLCSLDSVRTSLRRSRVAVMPVGLHPYYVL